MKIILHIHLTLREKYPYLEFFRCVFSRIRTEYGEYAEYLVRMRENTDQKNSKYGHFPRSVKYMKICQL